ncbi:uncharacterized protein OCT59_004495 [Rhizophagus irregularis]|uniref:uncharacterized protein n=1 Tax=Rhizophagus irregularis TaxID=588596 RepID=UPI00332CF726|nr:hypothetical protein OCT59_004495 [Rhizophagus irregularis]
MELRRFMTSWNLKIHNFLDGTWIELRRSIQNFEGCRHFWLFGQFHDRILKVFGLLDKISKGFGFPAPGRKNFEVNVLLTFIFPLFFRFWLYLKELRSPDSHLKELRRSYLSFERTSKVLDFHLEELRRPQLPFKRTSKVPGSHLAYFEGNNTLK